MTSIIERLKSNTSAFGLMDKELREVAEKIGKAGAFEYWSVEACWCEAGGDHDFMPDLAYRLRADYECKHPKTWRIMVEKECGGRFATVCRWCGAEIKPAPKADKKGGWVEYEVVPDETGNVKFFWVPGKNHRLHLAPGMVGFGGIKHHMECECGAESRPRWRMEPPMPCEKCGPYRPVAVRFWKEAQK